MNLSNYLSLLFSFLVKFYVDGLRLLSHAWHMSWPIWHVVDHGLRCQCHIAMVSRDTCRYLSIKKVNFDRLFGRFILIITELLISKSVGIESDQIVHYRVSSFFGFSPITANIYRPIYMVSVIFLWIRSLFYESVQYLLPRNCHIRLFLMLFGQYCLQFFYEMPAIGTFRN